MDESFDVHVEVAEKLGSYGMFRMELLFPFTTLGMRLNACKRQPSHGFTDVACFTVRVQVIGWRALRVAWGTRDSCKGLATVQFSLV